jgi:arylsulfatase A-like enzyme
MKKIRWNLMIVCASFSVLLIFSGPATPAAIEKVILISIDTLRADFLGCYNPEVKTTPNLDRFASENVVFLNDTAQAATTAPSHKSIFYSVYPSIHKTTLHTIAQEKLKSSIEMIRESGFETAAFTGGGQLSQTYGFARGFNSYKEASGPDVKDELKQTRKLTFDWLDKHYSDKFFLFLHTFEPHCPYDPPATFFQKWSAWYEGRIQKSRCHPDFFVPQRRLSRIDYSYIRSLYSAEVNYVDDFLGDLFRKLKALGVYDKTLIIFLSDHGESLGERGYIGHSQLYDVQLHVPLMIHIPGTTAKRISSPVVSVGVMPTIFELLGIHNNLFSFQGKSLLPLIQNPMIFDKNVPRISEEVGHVRVRIGDLALIFSPHRKGEEELYNLKNDPEEIENIADQNLEIVEKMKLPYFKMLSTSKDLSAQFVVDSLKNPAVSQETIEKLKALGYVAE